MRLLLHKTILTAALVGAAALPAAAGPLEEAVRGLDEGRLRFSYPTRGGVRGDGRSLHFHDVDERSWESDCQEGPARVELRVRDGRVVDVDLWVGGRWRALRGPGRDLGEVPCSVAAEFLLDLAASGAGEPSEDAVVAACVADSVEVWPRLLELARDRGLHQDLREQAVFWLGQAAGEKAAADLGEVAEADDEDLEIRRKAVFSLSQIEGREAFERLRRIATTHGHPRVRREALFWLAQRDEAEAVDVFEEILTASP